MEPEKMTYPKDLILSYHRSKEEKTRLEILAQHRVFIFRNGTLCILRGENTPQTYVDIDAAIRAQRSIVGNYFGDDEKEVLGEIDKLFYILGATEETHALLLEWNQINDNVTQDIVTTLTEACEDLKRVRDESKKLTREQLIKIVKMEDSLGRSNPGALAARSVAAENRIIERIKSIPPITLFCISRRHTLMLEKKQIEANIMLAAFRVKMILNSSDEFFKHQNVACQKINQVLYLLQSAWVNPYFVQIAEVEKHLDKTKERIGKKNIESAKRHLEAAKNVLKAILI